MTRDPKRSDTRAPYAPTRRRFLLEAGAGVAGLGLLHALGGAGFFAPASALRAVASGRAPKAKRCIFLFMFGGPSQMDLFDYKPELQKRDGQGISMERRVGDVRDAIILGSKRKFARHGETGQWCSDALPNIARHMDELAVVKSLYTDSFAHGSAILAMNSGQILQGHPSMGSWISYGLGADNPDLPAFVVMHDPRGGPISGPANWSSGYMPAAYQGTLFRSGGDPLLDLAATRLPRADAVPLQVAVDDDGHERDGQDLDEGRGQGAQGAHDRLRGLVVAHAHARDGVRRNPQREGQRHARQEPSAQDVERQVERLAHASRPDHGQLAARGRGPPGRAPAPAKGRVPHTSGIARLAGRQVLDRVGGHGPAW